MPHRAPIHMRAISVELMSMLNKVMSAAIDICGLSALRERAKYCARSQHQTNLISKRYSEREKGRLRTN